MRIVEYYSVIDSTYASVPVWLPKGQWDYLSWLMAQGFDLEQFTRRCDRRRRAIEDTDVALADFLSFATDRVFDAHHQSFAMWNNLVQPVFAPMIEAAIDKTDAFFRNSGPNTSGCYGLKL